jgi:HlyD family secretion protein
MKKVRIIVIVLAAILAGAAGLYLSLQRSGNDGVLLLSGTIEVTEARLGFKTAGRIAALHAEEGQRVRQGQLLAELESAEIRSVVAQHAAAVRNAEAVLDKARKDLERYEQLFREGAVPVQQLDAARTGRYVAEAQRQQAAAALRASEVRLRDTTLIAPSDGTVLLRIAEPGEAVQAGGTVYSIGVLDAPWVRVYVSETSLGLVKLGQRAEVRVDSFADRIFDGTVTQISSEAEFTPKHIQTQEERVKLVYGVKVSVWNDDRSLKPGMPADVTIAVRP